MYADLWGRRKPKAEFQLKDRIACFGFLLWEAEESKEFKISEFFDLRVI